MAGLAAPPARGDRRRGPLDRPALRPLPSALERRRPPGARRAQSPRAAPRHPGNGLGKPDLTTLWPVRVLVLKAGQPVGLALSRDTYTGALAESAPIPPEWLRECLRILIESNARRMPAAIEKRSRGLLFPPPRPAAPRSLSASPRRPPNAIWIGQDSPHRRRSGLLREASRGALQPPAGRRSRTRLPQRYRQDSRRSRPASPGLPGRGQLSDHRHRRPRPRSPLGFRRPAGRAAATPNRPGRPEAGARRLRCPPQHRAILAHEGLGLVALRDQRTQDARENLAAATDAASTCARCWLEFARLNPDKAPRRSPRPPA